MKRILAAALFVALGVMPATASSYHSFRCSNSTVLRVIFNDEAGTATVVPFARPSIRLHRADADGDQFRFVRRSSHELRGSLTEVHWRIGQAEWVCRRGG